MSTQPERDPLVDAPIETPKEPVSTEAVDVQTLVTSALTAIAMQSGDAAQKLGKLDELMKDEKQKQQVVNLLVEQLGQQPDLVKQIGFWSTLPGQGASRGTCYFEAINLVAKKYVGDAVEFEDADLDKLPPAVMKALFGQIRRTGTKDTFLPVLDKVKKMAGRVLPQIAGDYDTTSTVFYEIHMAELNAGNLDASENMARASMEQAQKAGNLAGEMQALGNIGGLIDYERGDFQMGMARCQAAITGALQGLKSEKNPGKRLDLERVVMNEMSHIVRIGEKSGLVLSVQVALDSIRKNNVFKAVLDANIGWAVNLVKEAEAFIDKKNAL